MISSAHWLGRLIRLPLRLVPPMTPMRILSGPLAGMRWLSTAAPHGCWLGIYERELQRLLATTLRPGEVFFDVGANVGYFSLLGSARVGSAGRVVAIEPLPRNLELLRAHLAMNAIGNVTVVAAAAGDRPGTASFDAQGSPSMGRLAESGEPVPIVTLDGLVASGSVPAPHVIKMDIEGAESRAVEGARWLLLEHKPALFLSTHGHRQHEACCSMLEQLGYRVRLRRDGRGDGQYEIVATPL